MEGSDEALNTFERFLALKKCALITRDVHGIHRRSGGIIKLKTVEKDHILLFFCNYFCIPVSNFALAVDPAETI